MDDYRDPLLGGDEPIEIDDALPEEDEEGHRGLELDEDGNLIEPEDDEDIENTPGFNIKGDEEDY